MKQDEFVRETFNNIKLSEKRTENILNKVLEHKSEMAGEKGESEMDRHELKPETRKSSLKRGLILAGAVLAVAIGVGVKQLGSVEKEYSREVADKTEYNNSKEPDSNISGEQNSANDIYDGYKYVYKASYMTDKGTYILYAGSSKNDISSGDDYVDAVIEVNKSDILYEDLSKVNTDDGLIDEKSLVGRWVYVGYDEAMETYPLQIRANKLILLGEEQSKFIDYSIVMREYVAVEEFLNIPYEISDEEFYEINGINVQIAEIDGKRKLKYYGTITLMPSYGGDESEVYNERDVYGILLEENEKGVWSKCMEIYTWEDMPYKESSYFGHITKYEEIIKRQEEGMTYKDVEELMGEGTIYKLSIYDNEGQETYIEPTYIYCDKDSDWAIFAEYSVDGVLKDCRYGLMTEDQ